MTLLNKSNLRDVANGAGFMGSGGGGPLTTGLTLVDRLPDGVEIEIVSVPEVHPDALTAMSADMGSPDAMLKMVKDPTALVAAFEDLTRFEEQTGTGQILYTVAVEVGGLNTIAPLAVAQVLGLQTVDADGAGRAVPSLTQTTFNGRGVSPYPSVLANQQKQGISILVHETSEVEALARPILGGGFGEEAGLAMWSMDRPTLEGATPIRGNVEVARQLGALLRTSSSPVQDVCDFFRQRGRGGYLLYQGVLQEPQETTGGGFDVGHVPIVGSDGSIATIYNQNENLIAWTDRSASAIAMAPDSICYLTTDGQPFSNADIGPMDLVGREVAVIGLIADSALREDPKIMVSFREALVALGYPGPYIPIEAIHGE